MTAYAADPVRTLVEAEKDKLLLQRIRGSLWLLLLTVSVYGLGEMVLLPQTFSRVSVYRIYVVLVTMAGITLLHFYPTRRLATIVALLTLGTLCGSAVASGNLTGDVATMTVLSVVLAILSATIFPWGVYEHAVLVALVALATFWNVYEVQRAIPPLYVLPGAAVIVVWVGSFYLLHDLERKRRAVAREAYERRRAEEQAREHQAALAHVARVTTMGEIAAQMAHELNQPLAAIVSYAGGCIRRMRGGTERPGEILEALDQISEQAVRASEILKRLRAFVRKGEPRRERIRINEVVQNAIHFAEVEAKDYGVAVRFEPASVPEVRADPIQLEQVVLNLVRNGFEAIREANGPNKELVIRTALDNGNVQVAVRDNGTGIAAEIAETLFEPFATTKANGLGMGLSISRSIVESHGGRLWATANPGSGTTFHFTLPIATGERSDGKRADSFRRR